MNSMKIVLLMILVSTATFGEEIWKGGECALLSTRDIGKICKDQLDGVITKAFIEWSCRNGKLNGITRVYNNGTLDRELSYKGDILDGVSKSYYPNGNLREEMICKENKLEGTFKEYNEGGKLWLIANFKDGKPEGIFKTYYMNGKLEYLDTYENGKKINRKAYDNRGTLRFDQNYTRWDLDS